MQKNYIDNKKFEELIQTYIKGDKSVEEELFENIGLLIDRLLNGYNFKLDREEAKQECFLLILKILKNFRAEKGKGFNFLTTSILNQSRLLYTKAKKYQQKIQDFSDYKLNGVRHLPKEDPND